MTIVVTAGAAGFRPYLHIVLVTPGRTTVALEEARLPAAAGVIYDGCRCQTSAVAVDGEGLVRGPAYRRDRRVICVTPSHQCSAQGA